MTPRPHENALYDAHRALRLVRAVARSSDREQRERQEGGARSDVTREHAAVVDRTEGDLHERGNAVEHRRRDGLIDQDRPGEPERDSPGCPEPLSDDECHRGRDRAREAGVERGGREIGLEPRDGIRHEGRGCGHDADGDEGENARHRARPKHLLHTHGHEQHEHRARELQKRVAHARVTSLPAPMHPGRRQRGATPLRE
ncbi:MAG: hypothetical protein ACJLS2_08330 [Microcella pacifica]